MKNKHTGWYLPEFPDFNHFLIYKMTPEDVQDILWKPRQLSLWEYGMPVHCNEATPNMLYGAADNWLTLTFFVRGRPRESNKNMRDPDFTVPAKNVPLPAQPG